MISSYLPLDTTSPEKMRLAKETRFIEKNTMDVLLQSIRRARKLSPPKIPDRIHVKNYKTILDELFNFACELRFALAPYLMITTPNYTSILQRHDAGTLVKALRPLVTLIQKYIKSLYLKFDASHYIIHIHGERYQGANELLFSIIYRDQIPAKTTKGLRVVFDRLFDYCALPPNLYQIYTAKEFMRKGFYLTVQESGDIQIVILLEQPGFPISNFPRGWEVVRAHREVYYPVQLSDSGCLSTADALNLSSIK